jgi:3-hydroxyisobutyrate dehydrogenase-like beta-hydroxyacid dehydrogenase
MLQSKLRQVGIGFMGIGKMGFNMAENLMRAGYQLVVYDKDLHAVDKLVNMGARGVSSPIELGAHPGQCRFCAVSCGLQ